MGVVKNLMVRVGADLSGLVAGFNKASNAPESFKKRTEKAMKDSVLSVGNLKKAMAQGGKNSAIVSLVDQIRELEAEQKALKSAGFSWGFEGFEGNERLLRSLKAELKEYTDSLNLAGEKAEEALEDTGNATKKLGRSANSAFPGVKKVVSWITGLRSGAKSSSDGIDRLTRTLKRFGLAAIGLKLTKALFGELQGIVSRYVAENAALQAQVNSLKSGLGQVLAPAINLVTNALSILMPYVVGVSNAIGSLITNLFGSGWTTVADGANAAAAATGGATAAQEKYNRTLAGFDEITKLNSSSGSGGGGGSASSTTTPVEGNLPVWLTDLSAQIKEAVGQGDYAAVGSILAGKLGEAVDSARVKLNDSSFKSRVQSMTDNAADIINGFFAEITLDSSNSGSIAERIGALIGDGISLGLSTADHFLEKVEFGAIGKALAQGINGALVSLNASDSSFGSVIANLIQSGIDGAVGYVENLDWTEVGAAVKTNLNDLFSGIDLSSALRLLGSTAGGIGTAIWTAISDDITAAKDYFWQHIEDAGYDTVQGILNGIVEGILNIGSWIKDNIFKPFIDGFKETFDIHSPSRHKDIRALGANIMAGIFGGIADAVSNPVAWIKQNVFQPLIAGFSKVFGKDGYTIDLRAKLTSWTDGLKNKAVDFTAKFTSWKDSLKNKSINFKAKFTSWKDSLKNKTLDLKANIKKGWSGSLSKKLGISSITSKLNMKLPKISIDWGKTTVFSKEFKYPKGFSIKWNAKGGIMNGATLFGGYGNTLFGGGEAGREAILPLDRNTSWMDKIADRVALRVTTSQGGAQEITINLVLDGKVVAKTVVHHVNSQAKATGKHPFAAYI